MQRIVSEEEWNGHWQDGFRTGCVSGETGIAESITSLYKVLSRMDSPIFSSKMTMDWDDYVFAMRTIKSLSRACLLDPEHDSSDQS